MAIPTIKQCHEFLKYPSPILLPGAISANGQYSPIDPMAVRKMRNQVLLWDTAPISYKRVASGHMSIVLA